MAGYDPERARRIYRRWRLSDLLEAYRARVVDESLEAYRHRTLIWALLAPHRKKKTDPPKPPTVLKELSNG